MYMSCAQARQRLERPEARAARLRGDLVLDLPGDGLFDGPRARRLCGRRVVAREEGQGAVDGRHLAPFLELAGAVLPLAGVTVQGQCDTTEQRCDNKCQSKEPRSAQ